MELTEENFKEIKQLARKNGACEDHMEIIEKLTFHEFMTHEEIFYWLYWFAYNIIKERWSEAEPAIMTDPKWAYQYAIFVKTA